ncbi:MAG: ankyrin repeat domain-containing protein [Labilithrix sp.]|nr:ankyrin repeat domain-containing protein [Labilithrix sp.]MCW5810313.1 ankyrin repeat domain-containing protein [Labilithrix sp.]
MRERAVLVAVQCVAIAWFSPGAGFPLDDAWIHQVVARTFAETGTLGFAPDQHGAAATSYLWAALLAINLKVFHVEPTRWALALNVAAAIATGQLLFGLVDRARPEHAEERTWRAVAAVTTLFACVSPNVLWFTTSGMEAMPFVALSLYSTTSGLRPDTPPQTRPSRGARGSLRDRLRGRFWGPGVAAGFGAGVLALLRPEAVPLGGLLVFVSFWRTRDVRAAARVAVPWLAGVALYVGSNLAKTGHALPSTLAGRRWLWFESTAGLGRVDRVLDFLDAWNTRLGSYTFEVGGAVLWVFVAIAAYGAVRLARGKAAGIGLVFVWALFHAAFYALMLPTPGHGGRYQPLTPLLFALCLPLGATFLLGELARIAGLEDAKLGARAALGVLPFVVLAAPVAGSLRKANALAVQHIETTEKGAGFYVKTLPPGNVAAFDIGASTWTSGRRVLDLGGLSDPKIAALLEQGRVSTWLEENEVEWLVLPEAYENVLPDFGDYAWRLHLRENAAIRLEPMRVFETPFERWLPAIKATWNAAPKQVVFRVHYPKGPPPAEVAVVAPAARRPIEDPAAIVPRRDRIVAEHMLAVLDAWSFPLEIHALPKPPPPSFEGRTSCAIAFGGWGFAVAGCRIHASLKTTLFEQAGRYLDAGDMGGAVRAIPHLVASVRRLADPTFHPPLAPLDPPTPGGAEYPASKAGRYGLALFALALVVATGIDLAARRGLRVRRSAASVASVASVSSAAALLFALGGCARDDDVARAVVHGRGAVEQALANGGSPNGSGGRVPILAAAHAGDAHVLALLIEKGADPAVKDANGVDALIITTRDGNPTAAAVVLGALRARGKGVDDKAGPRVRTALQDACAGGNVELVRLLLDANASPNEKDWFGQTPLHIIAGVEGLRAAIIAQLLLQHDADASLTDARGFTPLHAAAMTDNFMLARVLAREPVRVRTPAGETALDVALRYRKDRAAEVLLQAGSPLDSEGAWPPLHEAARMDAEERIAALLAIGADTRRRFAQKTALDIAKEHGSKRAITLLEAGAHTPPRAARGLPRDL